MNTKPLVVTGSAYSKTPVMVVVPPFAAAPRDFSRIVVSPPACYREGCLFISPRLRAVYSSHQAMRLTSFSPIPESLRVA